MFGALLGMLAPSDEELVRRFKAGDRDAFSEVVKRYQDRVYTLCLRWMGEASAAEDTAQEVFLSLYKSLADFRGDSKLSTWIFRVATNHCKNRRLHNQRRAADRHEPLEGTPRDDAPPRGFADEKAGTDRALHRSEAEHLIGEALASLD